MLQLVTVMKAANKFKRLLTRRRPLIMQSILGEETMLSAPPEEMEPLQRANSDILDNRQAIEGNLVSEGISRNIEIDDNMHTIHEKKIPGSVGGSRLPVSNDTKVHPLQTSATKISTPATPDSDMEPGRGHAHDPLEDTLYLNIGDCSTAPEPEGDNVHIVSESPGAVEGDIYEKAYEIEINRIIAEKKTRNHRPTIFLTKRVEAVPHLREHADITDFNRVVEAATIGAKTGLARLAELAKGKMALEKRQNEDGETEREKRKRDEDGAHIKGKCSIS
jgi:[calcium/calmodulin-dependent protein kinase] kinase